MIMKKYSSIYSKAIVLTFVLCISSFVYGEVINGINYSLDKEANTASVIADANNKYSGDIVIPKAVTYGGKEYKVTSISDQAMWRCSGITSVKIPESVVRIGADAFYACTKLTSIDIPNSVTIIGGSAFNQCSALASVTLPNSLKKIEGYMFTYCKSLKSVVIPNSVTSIGAYAFSECESLTSVTISESVTYIDNYVFYNCNNLKTVINMSVTPQLAFSNTFSVFGELHVPEGCKDVYAESAIWKHFTDITDNPENPTAITAVKVSDDKANNSTYSLTGQRVSSSSKGLVITNGTKVIRR